MRGHEHTMPRVLGGLVIGLALSVVGQAAWGAAPRSPKPKSALDGASIAAALSKLETQQEEVLRRLDAAKKELSIIKVRAATIPTGISSSGGSCN